MSVMTCPVRCAVTHEQIKAAIGSKRDNDARLPGEALAAIAAFSGLRIIIENQGCANGSAIEVSGGVIIGIGERAAQNGRLSWREFFANVRRVAKFLKKDGQRRCRYRPCRENSFISTPEIAFRLIIDEIRVWIRG